MGRNMRFVFALTAVFISASLSFPAFAAGDVELEKANIEPDNIESLQRGARNFMNYCSGCHSARYVRFKTIGKYLELSEEQLINNLMFNAEKTLETMDVSMRPGDAERWFGTVPPDLSLMARSKGADYIFTFLKSFYVDADSPTGVDNAVLEGTSMPHVLWELQGFQRAIFSKHTETSDDGEEVTTEHITGFEPVTSGSMASVTSDTVNAEDYNYDDFVRDTANFLVYIAEPIRSERRQLGKWVIAFLFFFVIIAQMLKKQIWKDVK